MNDNISSEIRLLQIITALCEDSRRCSICFRSMDSSNPMNCEKCKEYYSDCICIPLTPKEIVFGEEENE